MTTNPDTPDLLPCKICDGEGFTWEAERYEDGSLTRTTIKTPCICVTRHPSSVQRMGEDEAVKIKPWMKQPGECCDVKGRPIYPGDLLRSPHFIGARRKQHYLYHVAVMRKGAMYMVPTCHLSEDKVKEGGSCILSNEMAKNTEIISGFGPEPNLSYSDRPRALAANAFGDSGDDDLTTAYMVGAEKGKDASKAEITRLRAEVDVLSTDLKSAVELGRFAQDWITGCFRVDEHLIGDSTESRAAALKAIGPELERLETKLRDADKEGE